MDTRIPPAVMRCLVSRVCVQLVKLSSGHTGFSGRLQTSINSLQRNSNTHKFTLSRWKKPPYTSHTGPPQTHTHRDVYIICLPLSLYSTQGEKGEEGEIQEEEAEVNSQLCRHIHEEMSGSSYRRTVGMHVVCDRNNGSIQYVWIYEKGKIEVKKRREKVKQGDNELVGAHR